MIRHPCVLAFVCAITAFSSAHPQIAPNHAPVKDDYPEEAFIIEEISTNISFDNDGNSTREQTTRVRIRTDAGVQHWGLLNIPFQSATQTVQVDYARVRKPDGSTVLTPEDNIQDLDAAITRTAPFYSDLREKHIAIKSLAKGDVLEYQVRWRPIKPLVPGQFWTEYNFQHDAIVLSERVDIKVPADRAVRKSKVRNLHRPSKLSEAELQDLFLELFTAAAHQISGARPEESNRRSSRPYAPTRQTKKQLPKLGRSRPLVLEPPERPRSTHSGHSCQSRGAYRRTQGRRRQAPRSLQLRELAVPLHRNLIWHWPLPAPCRR